MKKNTVSSTPVRSALQIALDKAAAMTQPPQPIATPLLDQIAALEQQLLTLKMMAGANTMAGVNVNFLDFLRGKGDTQPAPEPAPLVPPKAPFYLDSELLLDLNRASRKAEAQAKRQKHDDDFEPARPVKSHSDDYHQRGENAFTTLFRDCVIETTRGLKKGQSATGRTVDENAPPRAQRYNVSFRVTHRGDHIELIRYGSKGFAVGLPLPLKREQIPVKAKQQ